MERDYKKSRGTGGPRKVANAPLKRRRESQGTEVAKNAGIPRPDVSAPIGPDTLDDLPGFKWRFKLKSGNAGRNGSDKKTAKAKRDRLRVFGERIVRRRGAKS